MQASGFVHVHLVDLFLAERAKVNPGSDLNFTALHFTDGSSVTPDVLARLLEAGADSLARANDPEGPDHGFLLLDVVRAKNPALLATDAGRWLERLTCKGTGCEGVIVLAGDTKLSTLAERTLGKASRWKQIAELNDLEGKEYKKGDCLALP